MYKVTIDLVSSGETTYTEKDEHGILDISWRRVINPDYLPENQTCRVQMKNVNGYWYDLLRSGDQALTGRQLEIEYDDRRIGTYTIYDYTPTDDIFEITADSFSKLETPISPLLTKEKFPQMPEENEGKSGNIIGGTLSDNGWLDKGMCTAYKIDTGVFHAAWNELYDIPTGQVYDKDGQALSFTFEYSTSLECTIINTTGAGDALEIYFNADGYMDESQNLITNPALILEKIVSDFSDLTLTGVSEAETIFTEKQYNDNSILITTDTWKSLFRRFGVNYNTHLFPTTYGEWKIKAHDFSNPQPVMCLQHGDFENYSPQFDPKNVLHLVKRKFFYHFRGKIYKYQPPETINTDYLSHEKELNLVYHRGNLSSYSLTITHLFLKKQPDEGISFDTLIEKLDFDLGDTIEFISTEGFRKREKRTYLVTKINSSGAGKVKIETIDIFSRNKGCIILLDEADPEVTILKDETDEDCPILL
jgi:hypothetical protein